MDYVLIKYDPNNVWICGQTYESLIWNDKTIENPSEEELNMKWEELKKENMRQERNQLLKYCDFRILSDNSDTNKQEWVLYRQQLRTLPKTWVDETTPFPSPPE